MMVPESGAKITYDLLEQAGKEKGFQNILEVVENELNQYQIKGKVMNS